MKTFIASAACACAEQREYRSRKAKRKEKKARKAAGQDEVSAAFKVARAHGSPCSTLPGSGHHAANDIPYVFAFARAPFLSCSSSPVPL